MNFSVSPFLCMNCASLNGLVLYNLRYYTVLDVGLYSQSKICYAVCQESVFVKHKNGQSASFNGLFYYRMIHRLITTDKKVLHHATYYSIQERSGVPPHVLLLNLWVRLWLMCNWLDEWVSHSTNPSKYCLIKRPLCLWLKTSKISFI